MYSEVAPFGGGMCTLNTYVCLVDLIASDCFVHSRLLPLLGEDQFSAI